MNSDILAHADTKFSPSEMMHYASDYALSKTEKPTSMVLGLAIMAGVFIGLAFVFYVTITTGSGSLNWGISRVAGGIAFSMGLVLVVICGGELFTSSVLSSIAVANRQVPLGKMLKGWGVVYIGNFFGAMLLLFLVATAGLHALDNGQWGLNALRTAQHKLHYAPAQAFVLGILCNMMVCWATWMTFSSKQPLTKACMVVMPVAMFVSTGFEHSIANMFMVPLGIFIQNFASAEFWQQVGGTPQAFADLTLSNFIFANLIPVTLGNIVGGVVLVGLSNWKIYQIPKKHEEASTLNFALLQKTTLAAEITMFNADITVETIMNTDPIRFTPETPVSEAVDRLLEDGTSGAPVLDTTGNLIGFFAVQDVLIDLWCADYLPETDRKVKHLMRTELFTVKSTDTVVQLAEHISVNKEDLYPTSSMGYMTSWTARPLHERARKTLTSRPTMYPVMDGTRFVGVVTRQDVMRALRPAYGLASSASTIGDKGLAS